MSIPLEDNHLSAARSIVLEYHKTLAEKRNLHQGNLDAQPSETIVFLGKNPDTPPSEQASNLDRPLDSTWTSLYMDGTASKIFLVICIHEAGTWDPNYAPGVDFLDHDFLSSKNSG